MTAPQISSPNQSDNTSVLLRGFDILLSATGLVALSPVMLILCIVGLFDTGSPIFVQQRLGRYQRPFKLIKFRTMQIGTASVGSHLASSSSITKFGHFLRKTKLDELPQLVNVLKGDMSLVGPRPGLENQTELTAEREQRGIFLARPGITGLGQIYNVDMSTPRKLARYDRVTLNCLTLPMYFKLLFATVFGRGSGDAVR